MKHPLLHCPIPWTGVFSFIALLLLAVAAPLQAAVDVHQDASSVTLANSKVVWKFDKAKWRFSLTDAATQEVVLDQAAMTADDWNRSKFQAWSCQATVTVQAVDDGFGKGQRVVPTASNEVTFTIEGPGEIAGVGNGDPACHEPDVASKRSAFNGHCTALVRAGNTPGTIKLIASAPDLKPTTLEITVEK